MHRQCNESARLDAERDILQHFVVRVVREAELDHLYGALKLARMLLE
jgi:hypothetical protein